MTNKDKMEIKAMIQEELKASLKEVIAELGIASSSNKVAKATPTKTTKTTKTTTKKSTKGKVAEPKKADLSAFEPKKDADGYYNWKSYKACREKYLKSIKMDYESIGKWLSADEYAKATKPFTEAFEYVKKSDRK